MKRIMHIKPTIFFEKRPDETYKEGHARLVNTFENGTDYMVEKDSNGYSTFSHAYGYLTAGKIITIAPKLLIEMKDNESIEDACKRLENDLSKLGIDVMKSSINPALAYTTTEEEIDIEIDDVERD